MAPSRSWALFLTCVTIALPLMCFFLQSDVLYNAFVANQVARGHLDVYTYFTNHPHLRHLDTVMPPLYYLCAGAYQKLLLLLHIDPVTGAQSHIFQTLFGARNGWSLWLGLLLIKLPNLIAGSVGLALLIRLSRELGMQSRRAALIWIASPIMLVTTLMQAQNDIFAVSVTVGALLCYRRRWDAGGMVLLGLAASLKGYALLLIPVTAILLSDRRLDQFVRLIGYGLLFPAITELPFLSHDFVSRVYGAHDAGSLFTATTNGRQPLQLWLLAYLGALFFAWTLTRNSSGIRPSNSEFIWMLLSSWVVTLTTIFVFSYWFPQWSLWLLPAAALLGSRDRKTQWIWLVLNAALLANNLLDFPGNMDGGMLAPIFGQGPGKLRGVHVYIFHLRVLWPLVPGWLQSGVYAVCEGAFGLLAIRAIQLSSSFSHVTNAIRNRSRALVPTIALPLLLLPYIGVMLLQHLTG